MYMCLPVLQIFLDLQRKINSVFPLNVSGTVFHFLKLYFNFSCDYMLSNLYCVMRLCVVASVFLKQ